MARRRISVERIKEVIRYGVTTELSERAIGRALKVSRTAVTKYLECFRGSGLTWEQAQELPDSELLAVLEGSRPARTSARYERLAERFPMMVSWRHGSRCRRSDPTGQRSPGAEGGNRSAPASLPAAGGSCVRAGRKRGF